MSQKNIEFYFDFLSPYSYLAWQWVKMCSWPFDFYPVVMGKVIKHYGTKGPAEIKSKRNYLLKFCFRYAKIEGILFNPPQGLPFNSLYALRCALAENTFSPIHQAQVIDALFSAIWKDGQRVGDGGELLKVFNPLQGLDGEKLLEGALGKEAKGALKHNTQQAIERGAFGVPTFFVDGEMFWGNDSIDHLERFLSGGDPLDREAYEKCLGGWRFD